MAAVGTKGHASVALLLYPFVLFSLIHNHLIMTPTIAILTPDDVLSRAKNPSRFYPLLITTAAPRSSCKRRWRIQAEIAAEYGPLAMDITCDCEDGAAAGNERAHAELCVAMINSTDNRFDRVGARIHDVTHEHWQVIVEFRRWRRQAPTFRHTPKAT